MPNQNTKSQDTDQDTDQNTEKQDTELKAHKEATQEGAANPPETGAEAQGTAEAGAGSAEFEKLRADYEQVKAERDQLVDRTARLQAEFENARKRAERERQEFKDFAMGSVVEKFLPVIDNFELALKATGTAEQLRSGVELIVKQMEETLRSLQVNPVPAVGEEFDPRHHEALGSVERDDLPDQHVAEEIRRGYKLRDRLLRPALVRVASNPKQTSD
ncbi:MAG: nucleotide exchange factor GrpE [Terracidiphilus sp.]